MICLGIESSCDETALAIVADGALLGSSLASQAGLHSIFGGVVPELASREHYHYIGPLYDELLAKTGIKQEDIDVVAVSRGPGLLGSLLVGLAFAKGLALALEKPLLGLNHLHAHLLAIGLEGEARFPALGLLASGGHTQLYRIESPSSFISLGKTLDDAAGEAFDKTGKILGLPYPGGKLLDDLAKMGKAEKGMLPCPCLGKDNLDFSFSGLKTAAAQLARKKAGPTGKLEGRDLENFCATFNLAIAEAICKKVKRAMSKNPDLRRLWLAGGVAANSLLREKLRELAYKKNVEFAVPSLELCADNAAMVAYAGWLMAREGYCHRLDLAAIPRGAKIPDDMLRKPAQ